MIDDLGGILYSVSVMLVPAIIAITFHEAAHGFVAWRLGDDTALRQGRVTFNPLSHIDRFGTLILPAILLLLRAPFIFGYAKPVPVNFARLHNPRRDMVWVALAGPGTNLLLAVAAGVLAHLLPLLPGGVALWLADSLQFAILINIILAVFNMIPIPPLDGGRVAVGILPHPLALRLARAEPYGMLLLLGLLLLLPLLGQTIGMDLNLLPRLLWPPVEYLEGLVLTLTGHGG